MNKLGQYKNGNYNVIIYDDGTKVRYNNENYMQADFPESMDIKISNACDMGCSFCHEKSVPNGALADLNNPIFNTIHPWTEIALGGGNVFEHPDLDNFLFKMSYQKVICNITVHLLHYIKYSNDIRYHVDHGTIHGIGVSINTDINDNVISWLKLFPNVVVHVIAGVVPWETLEKLANNDIKILILGYKDYGRGKDYIQEHNDEIRNNIQKIEDNWDWLIKSFKVVSFDNLALEQLHVNSHISKEEWNRYYMGEDGAATFYIDATKMEYAKSSTSPRHKIDVENVDTLFKRVQNNI